MLIRRVQECDTTLLRDVRLRALAEASYAFWETLAEVEDDPLDEWEEWTRGYTDSSRTASAFVALASADAEQAEGMAGAYVDQADRQMIQVWGVSGSIRVRVALVSGAC